MVFVLNSGSSTSGSFWPIQVCQIGRYQFFRGDEVVMLVGKVENRLISLILSIKIGGNHMEFHVQKLAIKNSVPKTNGNYMQ
jgi:hypothetical protein